MEWWYAPALIAAWEVGKFIGRAIVRTLAGED